MKRLLICLSFVFVAFGYIAMATNAHSESLIGRNYSPQVCQFSLSSYQGTLSSGGYTDPFTVGLSCPQEKDVYATVVVFVDGEHAASKVVMVPANKTVSASVSIKVPGGAGKSYRLVVQ